MAYADKPPMSNSRITAIVIVALLHALLGYAFVTGLAYNVVKQVAADLKTFDVEEPPPPEEEPPPPPPDVPQTQPPPIVSPPPMMRMPSPSPPMETARQAPPPDFTYKAAPVPSPAPVAPAPVPTPPPPKKAVAAKSATGSLQGLFRGESDYPPAAAEREEEGTVGVSLTIGTNGRVTACSVTSGSGSRSLDSATCSIIKSRARYTPARDTDGNPTTGSATGRITWRLQ